VTGPWHAHAAVTAARVLVVLTHVIGTVQSVGAGSFTAQLFGGLVVTVDSVGASVFAPNGSPTSRVSTGQTITAYGAADPGSACRG
jgi:hypothetical protein